MARNATDALRGRDGRAATGAARWNTPANRNKRTPGGPLPSVQFYTFVAERKSLAARSCAKRWGCLYRVQEPLPRSRSSSGAAQNGTGHLRPRCCCRADWSRRQSQRPSWRATPASERQSARRPDRVKTTDSAAFSLEIRLFVAFFGTRMTVYAFSPKPSGHRRGRLQWRIDPTRSRRTTTCVTLSALSQLAH